MLAHGVEKGGRWVYQDEKEFLGEGGSSGRQIGLRMVVGVVLAVQVYPNYCLVLVLSALYGLLDLR